ncbi:PREDICTED: uncharacterized protein LOC105557046 [Vollenhovia emeryi]|uniref:uncharacterized protein LOC105557046 n=1 Tax=Vollenhovia emeryi TaxID=411798 RepID=UPI0005F4B9A9|nr:PREDICTED: uncharacterized protein LOC105557046 [Vollenhovia emeryi]
MLSRSDKVKVSSVFRSTHLNPTTEGNGQQDQTSTSPTTSHSDLYNQLSACVEKYAYGLGEDTKPFVKWLQRHEYTVVTETKSLPPEMQTRLILDKIGQTEFDRLVNHVAPRNPTSMPQNEVIETLKDLFRDKVPITRRRIEILNYRYDKSVPITEHIDRINRHASDFDRAKLTDDNLRILLLLQSFCYSSETDELKKIALRVVEKNANASLKDVVAELEAHMNVSTSLKMLENPTAITPTATINAVHAKYKGKTAKKRARPTTAAAATAAVKPETKCNGCRGAHQRSAQQRSSRRVMPQVLEEGAYR